MCLDKVLCMVFASEIDMRVSKEGGVAFLVCGRMVLLFLQDSLIVCIVHSNSERFGKRCN